MAEGAAYFKSALQQAGFAVEMHGRRVRCAVDAPTSCQQRLERVLRQDGEGRIREFVTGFDVLLAENHGIFLSSIIVGLSDDNDESIDAHRFCQDDSLLKLLLRIQVIQGSILERLVPKVVAFSSERNIGEEVGGESYSLAVRILNHIKWCEVIYNPAKVLELLLDALPGLPLQLKIDVISALPCISSDFDHACLIETFLDLFDASPELVPCILETICNFNLASKSDLLRSVTTKTLEQLQSVELPMVPSIVRSLLEFADKESAKGILETLRTRLDEILSLEEATGSSVLALTINVLKSAFLSRLFLFDSLQVLIEESKASTSAIDLWILYSLAESTKFRIKIYSIIAKKVGDKSMPVAQIQKSVRTFKVVLEESFTSMMALATTMLSAAKVGNIVKHAQRFALVLYEEMYFEFADSGRKQEIVASLIMHVGSPHHAEADSALGVLLSIVDQEFELPPPVAGSSSSASAGVDGGTTAAAGSRTRGTVTLRNFLPFLKNILDDVRLLSHNQLRVLFKLIFKSANIYSTGASSSDASTDDIAILLNKFAGSVDEDLKKIAVIGYVAGMLVSSSLVPQQGQPVAEAPERSFLKLLGFLGDDCDSLVFLFDELSDAIELQHVTSKKFATFLLSQVDPVINKFSGNGRDILDCSMKYCDPQNAEKLGTALSCSMLPHVKTLASRVRLGAACLKLLHGTAVAARSLLDTKLLSENEHCLDNYSGSVEEMLHFALALRHTVEVLRELLNALCVPLHGLHSAPVADAVQSTAVVTLNNLVTLETQLAETMLALEPHLKNDESSAIGALLRAFGENNTAKDVLATSRSLRAHCCVCLGFDAGAVQGGAAGPCLTAASRMRLLELMAAAAKLLEEEEHRLCSVGSVSVEPPYRRFISSAISNGVFKATAEVVTNFQAAVQMQLEGAGEGDPLLAPEGPRDDAKGDNLQVMMVQYSHVLGAVNSVLASEPLVSETVQFLAEDAAGPPPPLILALGSLAGTIDVADFTTSDKSELYNLGLVGAFGLFEGLMKSFTDNSHLDVMIANITTLEALLLIMVKTRIGAMPADTEQHARLLSDLCKGVLQRPLTKTSKKGLVSIAQPPHVRLLLRCQIQWASRPLENLAAVVDDMRVFNRGASGSEDGVLLTGETLPLVYSAAMKGMIGLWASLCSDFQDLNHTLDKAARAAAAATAPTPALDRETALEMLALRNIQFANDFMTILSIFKSMLKLTKDAEDCTPMLSVALHDGGRFIQSLLANMRTVSRLMDVDKAHVGQMATDLPTCIKVLQTLCIHGKLQRINSLVKETPAIKKALERLLFMVKSLLQKKGSGHNMTVGTLPYKLLDGKKKARRVQKVKEVEEEEEEEEVVDEEVAAEEIEEVAAEEIEGADEENNENENENENLYDSEEDEQVVSKSRTAKRRRSLSTPEEE